jgi:hypothetical protein
VCGCTYAQHRTGLTFRDVRRMMFDQEDPNRSGWWRQKRRHSVLGYWREMKIHLWYSVHGYCEAIEEAA